MGVGVPAVASPVGINSELIQQDATGFLSSGDGEWYATLKALVENWEKRQLMGDAGRRLLESRYSQERFAAKYFEIMECCHPVIVGLGSLKWL